MKAIVAEPVPAVAVPIVGAPGTVPSGAAYLFDLATGQELLKFSASDGESGDRFGTGVGLGATRVVDVRSERIADVQRQLGMHEGFDVGLEMSGNPTAFGDMIDSMCHGGKIAMLGIPSEPIAIDWNKVVFNMLTIKGIYGREMYETWYKMQVMIESGLDISPLITHRFPISRFEEGFEVMGSGKSGKVVLDWTQG